MARKKEKDGPLPPRVTCPVCGGKGDYRGEPTKSGLCECEGCKLLFVGSPPGRAELAKDRDSQFAGLWRGAQDGRAREESETAGEVMAGFFAHVADRRSALNGFDRNVLDAFSGMGFRLREFQRYGWDVYGMDPSRDAVEYAKACFLDARQGWFDEGAVPERTFDLVLFAGSFGCFPEPLGVMNRLKKILRPKGLVFVGLAGEPVSAKMFDFTGETLCRLFMENGFQVLEQGEFGGGGYAWFSRKKDAREPKARAGAAVEAEAKNEPEVILAVQGA